MKNYQRERQQRFSFRKLSVGLVSALVGTYFMASQALPVESVKANSISPVSTQQLQSVSYEYLLESDLTEAEQKMIVRELPNLAVETDDVYYLVYRPQVSPKAKGTLPKSGDDTFLATSLAGVGLGLLLIGIKVRPNGKTQMHSVLLLTALGASVLTYDVAAERLSSLIKFNQVHNIVVGEQLPKPLELDGYDYVGYLKKEKAISSVQNVDNTEEPSKEESSSNTTVVDEKPSVNITTREEEVTSEIPFTVQYVDDASLEAGVEVVRQEGVNGRVLSKYLITMADDIEVSRELISNQTELASTPQIIARGIKLIEVPDNPPTIDPLPEGELTETTISEVVSLSYDSLVKEDATLTVGEKRVEQAGVNGSLTNTYKVTSVDGVEVSREEIDRQRTEPVQEIILVGTKPSETVETEITTETIEVSTPISFETKYRENSDLTEGEEKELQAGKDGLRTITYLITKNKGVEVKREQVSETVQEATPRIVERGTKEIVKPVVTTEAKVEPISFTTRIIEDRTMSKGVEVVEQEGKAGSMTTTYEVTMLDGKEISRQVKEQTEVPAVEEIKRVGTADPEKNELDWTRLNQLIDEEETIRSEARYTFDTAEDKTAYDTEINRAKALKNNYLNNQNASVTQDQINAMVMALEERKRHLDGLKTKPELEITKVLEDDLGKKGVVTYQLTDPTKSFVSAKAKLYDGDVLVKEVLTTDLSKPVDLTGLDYFKPYTLKTELTYKLGEGVQSEEIADVRKIELELKKIEFKDIDEVALYRLENGRFVRQSVLTALPQDINQYVVKIKSDHHKEAILPVSSITEMSINGQKAYNVQVAFDELVQDKNGAYSPNYNMVIAHSEPGANIFTSFKELVEAIKKNPEGEFRLGADLSAAEMGLESSATAYISEVFTGKLLGAFDNKSYAIFDLVKPLFAELKSATVTGLDLKNVAIDTNQSQIGSLAKKAMDSIITNVAANGSITAHSNIGGLVGEANQTVLEDVRFEGNITATTRDGNKGSNTGGIVGLLENNNAKVNKAYVDAIISVNGGSNNFRAGALAGKVDKNAVVENSYAKGSVINRSSTGQVAGLIGSTWQNGIGRNLISEVAVTNGNVIHGDSDYKRANITDTVAVPQKASGNKDKWTTFITAEDAKKRLAGLGLTARLDDSSQPLVDNTYAVDYSKVNGSQAGREIAYANAELLTPFYNKEYIVFRGNKISEESKLYKDRLIDVVPMIDDKPVTDIIGNKTAINRLMLHYEDWTVEYLPLTFRKEFRNNRVAEYLITGTDLIYTPEAFLSTYQAIENALVPSLSAINFDSTEVRDVVGVKTDNVEGQHLSYLYLEDTFNEVKKDLPAQLRRVLAMDKSINTEGKVIEQSIIDKISNNKAAFLLGLSYLNRWYDINFGKMNTKELTAFKHDFFGNQDASTLDTIIQIGQSGYDALVAKNNVSTYDNALGQVKQINGLSRYLERYRYLFLPDKTENEWLKENTKAYVVESESLVPEANTLQKAAYGRKNNKYSVGVYDKLTSNSWNWKNMLLPLLTLKDESVYVISNMSTISFGGYERYLYDKDSDGDFITYMRNKVDQAAQWQRDHNDFWYKILSDTSKDKMFRNVLNYDGFNYKDDEKKASWRTLLASDKSIQQFFGPVSKFYKPNGSGAYADGSQTHFVVDRMLDQYGTSVYTHEMVHNSDGPIYFEGHGRREGLGAELFALGLLQNPNNLNMHAITINTMLRGDKADEKRVHTANPVERFKNVKDVDHYVHGMFDAIYLLDYLESQSIIKQTAQFKKDWLRRIDNYYITDKYNKETHAGNVLHRLTDEEVAKLTSLDALIDGNILTKRAYGDTNKFERNGYFTINMFSPIFAALDNKKGAPGDVMFRRMAYELLAAKGYNEGFLPYVSFKYGKQALDSGSKTWSGWYNRDIGLVTDDIVFKNVFGNTYSSWADFKKAMFKERTDKLSKLKPISITYKLGNDNAKDVVTISSYEDLQKLMDEAMAHDAKNLQHSTESNRSWVYKLKAKIYNAYLRETDDFRQSIFK